MKKVLLLLCLIGIFFVSCQKSVDDWSSAEVAVHEASLPNYLDQVHPSILASSWWKQMPDISQQLIASELSGSLSPLTIDDVKNMQQIVRRSSLADVLRGKNQQCGAYPVGNIDENVDLSSQADVDAFGALGCKHVIGRLRIVDTLGPDPICDLTALSKIKSVGGSLNIFSPCLETLDGLDNIKSVGELGPFGFVGISGPNLTDISALSKLQTVTGSINVLQTEQLTSLGDAFNKISSIESGKTSNPLTSQYTLNLDDNLVLEDISGLGNLERIERDLFIIDHPALTDLNDLSDLQDIGNAIGIARTGLTNVDALAVVEDLTDFLIVFDNPDLTDCCGFFNLVCANPPTCDADNVGGTLAVGSNGFGCEVADIRNGGPCN